MPTYSRILRLRKKLLMFVIGLVFIMYAVHNRPHSHIFNKVEDISPLFVKPVCAHPELEMWPSFLKSIPKPKPLTCSSVQANWVAVEKGAVQITHSHVNVSCDYTPIVRGANDFAYNFGPPVKRVRSGFKIRDDFFVMTCNIPGTNERYNNLHSGIAPVPVGEPPSAQKSQNDTYKPLDILMFGFDSTSRLMWRRYLPRSHDYLMNVLHGVLLGGYNIVGDGTPQALLPILTGMNEQELPEARRGYAKAKPVDGHPWIWKELKRAGYMTQYGEDMANIGTFHYRMLGFNKQPVDHYMRPFYMHAESIYKHHKPFCLGSLPRHVNMLKWVREFFDAYQNRSKFSFVFHSEFSHGNTGKVNLVDDDLLAFLKYLHNNGHLDNTLLILMADHGARFHDFRRTVQGKQEERMPYMYLRLPPSFIKKYPLAQSNLELNAKRLTTPYDIHATFHDILSYDSLNTIGDVKTRGISLLKAIPHTRTCANAAIEMHWCACAAWQDAGTISKEVQLAANTIINVINNLTVAHRDVCTELKLEHVKHGLRYVPNKEMLMFKQSSDVAGYVPDLTDKMLNVKVHYQITLITTPGLAEYEATVKQFVDKNKFILDTRDISRTNRYGDQPHCVATTFPHLRQFCYCNNQLNG